MRAMPFMKRKKGVQFAGVGIDAGGGGGGSPLPIASADMLGGVKIGDNLSITAEGVLSASGGEITISTNETKIGTLFGSDLYAIAKETTTTPNTTYQEYFDASSFYINPMFGIWYCIHSNGDVESIPISVDRTTYRSTYHIKLTSERRDATIAATRQYFIFIYTKN